MCITLILAKLSAKRPTPSPPGNSRSRARAEPDTHFRRRAWPTPPTHTQTGARTEPDTHFRRRAWPTPPNTESRHTQRPAGQRERAKGAEPTTQQTKQTKKNQKNKQGMDTAAGQQQRADKRRHKRAPHNAHTLRTRQLSATPSRAPRQPSKIAGANHTHTHTPLQDATSALGFVVRVRGEGPRVSVKGLGLGFVVKGGKGPRVKGLGFVVKGGKGPRVKGLGLAVRG